jgi:hypothetical protein
MRIQSGVSRPERQPPFLLALAIGGSLGGRIPFLDNVASGRWAEA